METQTQSPYRAARDDRTPMWAWVVMALGIVVTWAATLLAVWLTMFGFSSTCDEPPVMEEVRQGQVSLLVVAGVAALPWALAWLTGGRRTGVLVCGLVAVAPALLALLNGLRTDAWVGGFCF